MPDLRGLRENTARIECEYAGEKIIVFYKPVLVTDETQASIARLRDTGDFKGMFAELRKLLIWWDITDGGVAVPFTDEGLSVIGVGITGHIINAIVHDVQDPTMERLPAQALPIPTSNGYPATAAWVPPPTMVTSSSQPNGQASPHGTLLASPSLVDASSGIPG